MNQAYLMSVLKVPYFSEKSTQVVAYNQYVFKVLPSANKYEIKAAVESMFNVKVFSVRTMNMKGKVRRVRRIVGRLKSYKKAYVTLAEGHQIDLTEKGPNS